MVAVAAPVASARGRLLPEILGSFGGCDCGGNGGSSGSGGIFGDGQSAGDRPSENIELKALAVVLMILAMIASALAIALRKILRQRRSLTK